MAREGAANVGAAEAEVTRLDGLVALALSNKGTENSDGNDDSGSGGADAAEERISDASFGDAGLPPLDPNALVTSLTNAQRGELCRLVG